MAEDGVSPGAVWPQAPEIIRWNDEWVVAWHDGRNDSASDCVNMHFCRNDIFLQAATVAGAHGPPLRLSVDPNDCIDASLVSASEAIAAAWVTFREERRTAFGRLIQCD
jgi:hypothetical protein